uniref:BHLH domain-containing protein n=1 Tax=Oryza glaberrima TaxID=4538 RepID=I1NYR3_ORYGL
MEIPPPSAGGGGGGGKPDRKTTERIRREQMNKLYSHLDSLVRSAPPAVNSIPSHSNSNSKYHQRKLRILGGAAAATTRPDRLGVAAEYIRQTQERVDMLREKKRELTGGGGGSSSSSGAGAATAAAPEVEVQHLGSGLHAILFTGAPPTDGASFHRAVRAVEDAGGQVQNAHFSVAGAKAVYTIHAMVNWRWIWRH